MWRANRSVVSSTGAPRTGRGGSGRLRVLGQAFGRDRLMLSQWGTTRWGGSSFQLIGMVRPGGWALGRAGRA